jgi:hypothetical protein
MSIQEQWIKNISCPQYTYNVSQEGDFSQET